MIASSGRHRVFAHAAPADMRKSYEGLSALVRQELGRDPLFCGGPRYVTGSAGVEPRPNRLRRASAVTRHILITCPRGSGERNPLAGNAYRALKPRLRARGCGASSQSSPRRTGALY